MNDQRGNGKPEELPKKNTFQEDWELRRLALLHEIKKELEDWGKGRLKAALIGIAVAGFIGIEAIGYVVIDRTLGSKLVEAEVSTALMNVARETAVEESKKAIDKMKSTSLEVETQGKEITEQIAKLADKIKSLDQERITLAAKAQAEREHVRSESTLALGGINERLDKLTEDLSVALENPLEKGASVEKLVAAQKDLSSSIKKGKARFSENSEFKIVIYPRNESDDEVKSILTDLQRIGFKVRLGNPMWPFGTPASLVDKHMFFDGFKGKVIMYRPNEKTKLTELTTILGGEFRAVTEQEFSDHPTASRLELRTVNFLIFIP